MNFFKRLFGRKNVVKSDKTSPPAANTFAHNLADFGFQEIQLSNSGKLRIDAIMAIAEFEKWSKARQLSFSYEVMYTSLLEEGALTVPLVIQIGEERFSVYFIYTSEEAKKYRDLTQQVHRTAYPKLIYFSALDLQQQQGSTKIIEPFQLADLRYDKGSQISGEYAMWWADTTEDQFSQSETRKILGELYELYRGYETYLTGYLLRQVKIVAADQLHRTALPIDQKSFILQGPEQKKVVLLLSQEKGIRFLFPLLNTSRTYRERFLRGVMIDLLATRLPLQQQDFPQDKPTDPNGYDWFQLMSRSIQQEEMAGKSTQSIGGMTFNVQAN